MDVMCCADIGHIFSLVIDVNDKEVINDTSTKTYVDAMVPVPDIATSNAKAHIISISYPYY
jgi:hypothetical protein